MGEAGRQVVVLRVSLSAGAFVALFGSILFSNWHSVVSAMFWALLAALVYLVDWYRLGGGSLLFGLPTRLICLVNWVLVAIVQALRLTLG